MVNHKTTAMKLPSLHSLYTSAWHTFRRFPVAILLAIISSVLMMQAVEIPYDQQDTRELLWKLVMSGYLGMLLFISISIFAEKKQYSTRQKILLNAVGLVLTGLYFLSIQHTQNELYLIRFSLFSLALHLLISFIPFLSKGEINGFWQYNKTLFIRFLTSALYTGVLYLGLLLALYALENLFLVPISSNTYANLWFALAGIFNTWFFLAGMPEDFSALDARTEYPKGLKIFTQYVLIPLITVYLIILYAYGIRIILLWDWPQGWVSYLIIGFSVAGILSLLLIYPIRYREENKWMNLFSRVFYAALFPLIIILFLAIQRRVSEYGITEPRYFVLLIAFWLFLVALYFLFSKKKNIKLIPISLFVFVVLSSYGPLSAFSVTLASQKSRFEQLLTRNNLLDNGKIQPAKDSISFSDRKQISSIVSTLLSRYGTDPLQPYFNQNLDSLMQLDKDQTAYYSSSRERAVVALMNMPYVSEYALENEAALMTNYYAKADKRAVHDIRGYEYAFTINTDYNETFAKDSCANFEAGNRALSICLERHAGILRIKPGDDANASMAIALYEWAEALKLRADVQQTISSDIFSIQKYNAVLELKILFENLQFSEFNAEQSDLQFSATVLVRWK